MYVPVSYDCVDHRKSGAQAGTSTSTKMDALSLNPERRSLPILQKQAQCQYLRNLIKPSGTQNACQSGSNRPDQTRSTE